MRTVEAEEIRLSEKISPERDDSRTDYQHGQKVWKSFLLGLIWCYQCKSGPNRLPELGQYGPDQGDRRVYVHPQVIPRLKEGLFLKSEGPGTGRTSSKAEVQPSGKQVYVVDPEV